MVFSDSAAMVKQKRQYIDSTPIATCYRKRISKNKVFSGIAEIGKSTYGWFYGFKLHMVINEKGKGLL